MSPIRLRLCIIASSRRKISQRLPGLKPLRKMKGTISYELINNQQNSILNFQKAVGAAGLSKLRTSPTNDGAASVLNLTEDINKNKIWGKKNKYIEFVRRN
ncbi:hypothetical protein TNCV_3593021 [Trichonephila clavipes]|nr:hypothetical protein TNCV_3593021 [Trichonephila clavipes]